MQKQQRRHSQNYEYGYVMRQSREVLAIGIISDIVWLLAVIGVIFILDENTEIALLLLE